MTANTAEDQRRTNHHYQRPPEFFTLITGGEWKVYSCNLWRDGDTETQSQARKLDLLAERMRLKPGMRVLDVGCGWGGPLLYLAAHHGVEGAGLTLSTLQRDHAAEWAASRKAKLDVRVCHWADFEDARGFDAIYTDEVIVHFAELGAFFAKARSLLRPGGRLVNKEVHFASSRYRSANRLMHFINDIYGETGNYRPLHDELRLLDEAGFALESVDTLPLSNYQRTAAGWVRNMDEHRERLEALCGRDYFKQFRTYLKLVQKLFASDTMSVDVVTATAAR